MIKKIVYLFFVGVFVSINSINIVYAEDKENPILHEMISNNISEDTIIDFIKSSDANIIHEKDSDGRTPLHIASNVHHIASNVNLVKFLLKKGADVNAKDKYLYTPLMFAVQSKKVRYANFWEIMNSSDILLGKTPKEKSYYWNENKKAEVNSIDTYNSQNTASKLLIEAGSNVNLKNENGKTALHNSHNKEIIRMLINTGADINVKDSDGKTPLHEFAYWKNNEAIKILIESGADINIKDKDGKTPLHYALQLSEPIMEVFEMSDKKFLDILQIILDAGADINIKDKDGKTPLKMAIKTKNSELVKMFLSKK